VQGGGAQRVDAPTPGSAKGIDSIGLLFAFMMGGQLDEARRVEAQVTSDRRDDDLGRRALARNRSTSSSAIASDVDPVSCCSAPAAELVKSKGVIPCLLGS